mmetsp:Transcript_19706/g.39043  ORF Transcript_19706/g.39043 Transcript_19706/m.39043 type:complete len:614 (+) Transcript_19706:66-1907(+)
MASSSSVSAASVSGPRSEAAKTVVNDRTGKLQTLAAGYFERAYGLNGKAKEDHDDLCKEAMAETTCSRRAFRELIYGHSYQSTLGELRAMVPGYKEKLPKKQQRAQQLAELGSSNGARLEMPEIRLVSGGSAMPSYSTPGRPGSANVDPSKSPDPSPSQLIAHSPLDPQQPRQRRNWGSVGSIGSVSSPVFTPSKISPEPHNTAEVEVDAVASAATKQKEQTAAPATGSSTAAADVVHSRQADGKKQTNVPPAANSQSSQEKKEHDSRQEPTHPAKAQQQPVNNKTAANPEHAPASASTSSSSPLSSSSSSSQSSLPAATSSPPRSSSSPQSIPQTTPLSIAPNEESVFPADASKFAVCVKALFTSVFMFLFRQYLSRLMVVSGALSFSVASTFIICSLLIVLAVFALIFYNFQQLELFPLTLADNIENYVEAWEFLAVGDTKQLVAALNQVLLFLDYCIEGVGLTPSSGFSNAVKILDLLHSVHKNLVREIGSTILVMKLVGATRDIRKDLLLVRVLMQSPAPTVKVFANSLVMANMLVLLLLAPSILSVECIIIPGIVFIFMYCYYLLEEMESPFGAISVTHLDPLVYLRSRLEHKIEEGRAVLRGSTSSK